MKRPDLSAALRIACVIVALATIPFGASARTAPTITAQQYAKSESLADFTKLAKLVKNSFVVPHWIGDTDRFWYRRDIATGHDFLIVDAATGGKQSAFDPKHLTDELSKVAGPPVSRDDLELTALVQSDSGESLTFALRGKTYTCGSTSCVEQPVNAAPADLVISPDNRWGAFSRGGNLWIRSVASGTERQLTTDGQGPEFGYGIQPGGGAVSLQKFGPLGLRLPPFGVVWSRDSQTVFVTRVDQRGVATYPFVETVPGDGSFRPILYLDRIPLMGEKNPVYEYFAIDIGTSTSRHIDLPTGFIFSELAQSWWGPGGNRYVLATADYLATAALFEIASGTQAVRLVISEHLTPRADLNTAYYNPPNIYLTKDSKELIWFSQRDGWGHLYLYDATTGMLRNRITGGDWLVRDVVHVDETRRIIYFTASGRQPGNPYYRYLYRINFDGSGLTMLSPETADHLIVGGGFHYYPFENAKLYQVVSPSGKYVVYTYSTPMQPPQTVIRTTSDGRLIATIERADVSALYAAGYHPPQEFTVKAADGQTDLWGVLYKPDQINPSHEYPVIDSEYTSPLYATTPRDFMASIIGPPSQLDPSSLTALGFVVVGIDARGTPDRSKTFLDYSYGRWKTMGIEDHVAAIKELGRRFHYLDLTRVGIVGWSFGGESAIRAMLEFPDFFTVADAEDPAEGQHNMYTGTEPWIGAPVYSDGSSLRPKANEVARNYATFDSGEEANRLKGHLLIFVAELDENVFAASTLQFTDALMKANKNFDLVFSPNAGHFFTYANFPTYAPYLRRRGRDYFIVHLLGAKLPAQPGTDFK